MGKIKVTWKKLASRSIYSNPYIEVVEDKVIKPDGSEGIYGFVKTRKTLGIVPLDEDNNIYLCRQFRYIFQEESWEIPRGFIDDKETGEEAARRELAEEAGLTTGKLSQIGLLRLSIGLLDEECKVFVAQKLSGINNFQIQKTEINEVRKFPLEEAISRIKNQEIIDGLTVGAIFLAKQRLKM